MYIHSTSYQLPYYVKLRLCIMKLQFTLDAYFLSLFFNQERDYNITRLTLNYYGSLRKFLFTLEIFLGTLQFSYLTQCTSYLQCLQIIIDHSCQNAYHHPQLSFLPSQIMSSVQIPMSGSQTLKYLQKGGLI